VTGALCLLLSGCFFPGLTARDRQVPRNDVWSWQKPDGTPFLDIQRALLECGALSPSDTAILMYHEYGDDVKSRLNHRIQVSACMEKAGYKDNSIWPDVLRALLKCRVPPSDIDGFLKRDHEYGDNIKSLLSHDIRASACMEKAGYINASIRYRQSRVERTCDAWKDKYSLPACQPGAPVMERSVERRLNSRYCVTQRSYELCKTMAINPSICDRMDFTRTEPVCLP
jgi:hypothetical protein